jgi:hypothetical protein
MATKQPKFFKNDEHHSFCISIPNPFDGAESVEDSPGAILRRVITELSRNHDGIASLIRASCEMDASAYSVYITGAAVDITRLGGEGIGYSIHVSIHSPMDKREPKTIRRVGKLPGAKH